METFNNFKKGFLLKTSRGQFIISLCFIVLMSINSLATTIKKVWVQEEGPVTKVIFDMDALVYLDATLDAQANQLVVTAPEEITWDIPDTNQEMIGLFEGSVLDQTQNKTIYKADIFPGAQITDSYGVNEDPTAPRFVIELVKPGFNKKKPSDPLLPPIETPQSERKSQGVMKIVIGKARNISIFKIFMTPDTKARARQSKDKVIIDVPSTDWSKVEAGERFLGRIRDKKSGNVITIESPPQEWDSLTGSEKPTGLIKDYYVEEATEGAQKLILRLEDNVHMISELHKRENNHIVYVLKFKKKETPLDEANKPDVVAEKEMALKNLGTYKPPPGLALPKKSPVAVHDSPFGAKPVHKKLLQMPQPRSDLMKNSRKPMPLKKKQTPFQSSRTHIPKPNLDAQASNEKGSIPAWVREAQKKLKT